MVARSSCSEAVPSTAVKNGRICARCGAPWHIGAVPEGEERKLINFLQLQAMARDAFTESTLRSYTNNTERGLRHFGAIKIMVNGEARFDACGAKLVVLRKCGVDVEPHADAIRAYDSNTPTARRCAALQAKVREVEQRAIEFRVRDDASLNDYLNLNREFERAAKMIVTTNRQFGLRREDGFFAHEIFRSKKAALRHVFDDLPAREFRALWEQFTDYLHDRGYHKLKWKVDEQLVDDEDEDE